MDTTDIVRDINLDAKEIIFNLNSYVDHLLQEKADEHEINMFFAPFNSIKDWFESLDDSERLYWIEKINLYDYGSGDTCKLDYDPVFTSVYSFYKNDFIGQ